jgi:SAM-dependent methyltransferase
MVSLFFIAILLELNRDLYAFLLRKRGLRFTAAAVLFHWFYFLYSSFVFGLFGSFLKVSAVSNATYWSKVIEGEKGKPYEDLWRFHMRVLYQELFDRWLDPKKSGLALKTDLYEEAVSDYNLLPLLTCCYDPVFAIDISYEVAQAACTRMSGQGNTDIVKILVSDVRNLTFKPGSFDLIFSNSTLDHFGKKEDLKNALTELVRVLKPGGTLIVTLDNPLNPVVSLRNLLPYAWLKSTGLIPYYMGRTMSRRELVSVLSSYGLQIQESGYISHVPRLPIIWFGRFLENNKNERLKSFLEKSMSGLEKLSLLPTRPLTGYYVAVKAVKR